MGSTDLNTLLLPPPLGSMGDSSENLNNRVKLRDGRFLAYRETGVPKEEAKHKIILVHGCRGSKNMKFSASKELIEDLGVYFVSYDRAGYGDSDPNVKRSVHSEADDIEQLADQLEIGPKFYLIGVSMGSYPVWGCLKHIPHKLFGVVFVSPVVNYRWPSLPQKLIKTDYRRVVINMCLRILKYAPELLHWWIIRKLYKSVNTILGSNSLSVNNQDIEVLNRKAGFPRLTKDKELQFFDTIRDDFVASFEQWDFEPADLRIGQESFVHIWHGMEDQVVPAQLQRCIMQTQHFINYHEIPQGGHLINEYNGICDAILCSLFLGEEEKMYQTIVEFTV